MIGRRLGISLAVASFVLFAIGSYAVAGPRDSPGEVPQTKKFEARLNGFQETPSVSSTGFGNFGAELVNPTTLDQKLYELDLSLFHIEPAMAWDRYVNPTTTEWFAFFYFGYFALLAVNVLPMVFFSRRLRLTAEFALGMITVYAGCASDKVSRNSAVNCVVNALVDATPTSTPARVM